MYKSRASQLPRYAVLWGVSEPGASTSCLCLCEFPLSRLAVVISLSNVGSYRVILGEWKIKNGNYYNGIYRDHWDYIGVSYWDYIGIMEKNIKTAIV